MDPFQVTINKKGLLSEIRAREHPCKRLALSYLTRFADHYTRHSYTALIIKKCRYTPFEVLSQLPPAFRQASIMYCTWHVKHANVFHLQNQKKQLFIRQRDLKRAWIRDYCNCNPKQKRYSSCLLSIYLRCVCGLSCIYLILAGSRSRKKQDTTSQKGNWKA